MTILRKMERKKPKICLYSKAGSGKTSFLLTLGARLQVLDLDDGVTPGQTIHDEFYEDRMSVDVIQALETNPSKAVAFTTAKAKILAVAEACRKGDYPYDYFGLDSYTVLADSAVRHIMSNSGKLGEAPKIQHWGLAFNELENLLVIMRSLPITFIMVAHEQATLVDEETKIEIATPGVKLLAKLPRFFDEVWYLDVKNRSGGKTARVLKTKRTSSILVRSRNNLADGIDTTVGFPTVLKGIFSDVEKTNGPTDAKTND